MGGFSFKVLCRFNDRRTQGQWSHQGITYVNFIYALQGALNFVDRLKK